MTWSDNAGAEPSKRAGSTMEHWVLVTPDGDARRVATRRSWVPSGRSINVATAGERSPDMRGVGC
jgi:hypothetical protein